MVTVWRIFFLKCGNRDVPAGSGSVRQDASQSLTNFEKMAERRKGSVSHLIQKNQNMKGIITTDASPASFCGVSKVGICLLCLYTMSRSASSLTSLARRTQTWVVQGSIGSWVVLFCAVATGAFERAVNVKPPVLPEDIYCGHFLTQLT